MAAVFPKTIVFYSYFSGIALWYGLRIYQSGQYLNWQAWLPVGGWLLGGFIGRWLLSLDRLVDVYLTHPETQLSNYVRYYLQKGQFRWAWATLEKRKQEQQRLTFRSALFQAVWVGLVVFVATSTSSLLGKAIVMGLGLHLLLDEWKDYLTNPKVLSQWLFWQIKREVSLTEEKIFLWLVTGVFLFATLLLL
ncbi:hypothetical protein A2160_04290 [Candidatus Beckwithbacteria bacterium RBG_13_42_9]|uniref:Uncharacterized protein n=1 Tax=Candidatus Beckwithbacteria bacterium RBG_13_42_9 TaxID=1797457 RepID=A0A1F5E6M3_9BACT|nr:MAG: hypothetical protein A2160_04290 [Candidatus Beckwithbacteria bacterium RBG_13_42_9]